METGITLTTATSDARLLVEAARVAEMAGFSSVWCYDHLSGSLFNGDGAAELWTMLGAIAVATERLRVGPLVLNVTTRQPAHIALAAATLQSLTAGRASLGLGAGSSGPSRFAAELDMFRLPHEAAPQRRQRLADTIGFLRALWAGAAAYDGRYAAFSEVRGVPVPDPPCPIVVGATGPKMSALAGRLADQVNLHAWQTELPQLIGVARAVAEEAGNTRLTVSVEGRFEPEWIDPSSSTRRSLARIGVDEVMVPWHPDRGLAAIRQAAPLLRH